MLDNMVEELQESPAQDTLQDPPKKYKVSQQVLSDFSATVDAKPDLTEKELLEKFPEFNNDKATLQSALDYSATSKSGKYKTVNELNSKFPEFDMTPAEKKREPISTESSFTPQNGSNAFSNEQFVETQSNPNTNIYPDPNVGYNAAVKGLPERTKKIEATQNANPIVPKIKEQLNEAENDLHTQLGAKVMLPKDAEKIKQDILLERQNPNVQYKLGENYLKKIGLTADADIPVFTQQKKIELDKSKSLIQNNIDILSNNYVDKGAMPKDVKDRLKGYEYQLQSIDEQTSTLDKFAHAVNSKKAVEKTPIPQTEEEIPKYLQSIGSKVNQLNNSESVQTHLDDNSSNPFGVASDLKDVRNFENELTGINTKQTDLLRQKNSNEITNEDYTLQSEQLKKVKSTLLDRHIGAKIRVYGQALGQIIDKERGYGGGAKSAWDNLFNSTPSKEEVNNAIKKLPGLSESERKYFLDNPSEVQGTAILPDYILKAADGFDKMVNPIARLIGAQDSKVQELKQLAFEKESAVNPDKQFEQPKTIIDTEKGDNYLRPIENPNAEKLNWGYGTGHGIAGAMATVTNFIIGNKGFGALAEASGLGATGTLIASNVATNTALTYDDAIQTAKSFTKDENEQKAYALITGTLGSLLFAKLDPEGLVKKAFTSPSAATIKNFISVVPKEGIKAMTPEIVGNFVYNTTKNAISNNLGASTLLTADQLKNIAVQAIFNPASVKDHNFIDETSKTFAHNAIMFGPLSFLHGRGVAKEDIANRQDIRVSAFEASSDLPKFERDIQAQVDLKNISKEDAAQKVDVVKKLAEIRNSKNLPKDLSLSKQADYAVNILNENRIKSKIEGVTDKAQINKANEEISALQEERTVLLTPNIEPINVTTANEPTSEISKPIQQNVGEPEGQGSAPKVQAGTNGVEQGNAETATPVLEVEKPQVITPKIEPIKVEGSDTLKDEIPVKQFAVGDGGTKGVFVSKDGKLYKSIEPLSIQQTEKGFERKPIKGQTTKEFELLSDLQGDPNIPKIGKIVRTSEGPAFEIEKLDEIEKYTPEEHSQIVKILDKLNDKGYHVGDKVTVMRRPKTKELVVVDFSSGYKDSRFSKDSEDYMMGIESKMSKSDAAVVRYDRAIKYALDYFKENGEFSEFNEPEIEGFQYKMKIRPFDIGTYPKEGFEKLVSEGNKKTDGHYGIIEYSKPLSEKDIKSYELEYDGQKGSVYDLKKSVESLLGKEQSEPTKAEPITVVGESNSKNDFIKTDKLNLETDKRGKVRLSLKKTEATSSQMSDYYKAKNEAYNISEEAQKEYDKGNNIEGDKLNAEYKLKKQEAEEIIRATSASTNTSVRLSDILPKEFIEKYPQLRNIKVSSSDVSFGSKGHYNVTNNTLHVTTSHESLQHTLSHEIGHLVWEKVLTKDQRKLFSDDNPITEHGKKVLDNTEKDYKDVYDGKDAHNYEDFAELFADNKGDLDKTILDKQNQLKVNPKEVPTTIPKKGKIKKSVEIKDPVMKQALEMDATTPEMVVAQHFINGGTIGSEAIQEIFGGDTINGRKKITGELRARISYLKKDGGGVDALAHSLWESMPEHLQDIYSTEDMKEAVINTITNFTHGKQIAKDIVERYSNSEKEYYENKYGPDHEIEELHNSLNEKQLHTLIADPTHAEDLRELNEMHDGVNTLTENDKKVADDDISNEFAKEIIKDEGLTLENLDSFKQLFNDAGFPYSNVDFENVKNLLNGEGRNNSEPGENEQQGVGDVGNKKASLPSEEGGLHKEGGADNGEPGHTEPKEKVTPKVETEATVKVLRLSHEAAIRELKTAEDKLAKEQAKQTSLFGDAPQKEMFANNPIEAKEILDPLKKKVKITKEAFDKATQELQNQKDRKDPELFKEKDFNSSVDDIAKNIIDFLTPQSVKDLKEKGIDIQSQGPGIAEVVKGAAEIIKLSYKAGKDIKEVIDQAMDYIKNNWDKSWGIIPEDKLRTMLEDGFSKKIEEDLQLKNITKEEIKNILNKNAKNKTFINAIKNSKIVQGAKTIALGTIRAFHPFLLDGKEQARDAAMIIRMNKGQEAFENVAADKASEEALNFWNKQKRVDNIAFMASMENPQSFGGIHGDQRELANQYKDRMNTVFEMISKIKDVNFIEDYFPHFWSNPDKARSTLPNLGKTPMEGNKSFLKKRFYQNIFDGLNAGLDLATYNPEEMVRLAEQNALHFKTANDIFVQLKDAGVLKYFTGKPEEGWVKINDPLFNKKGAYIENEKGSTVSNELAKSENGLPENNKYLPGTEDNAADNNNGKPKIKIFEGAYYAKDAVAAVLNNFTGKGLFNKGGAIGTISSSIRKYNNIKNTVQLGLGLFHFTTTTLDATVTGFANGLKLVTTGKPLLIAKGAFDIVKSATLAPNLIESFFRGYKTNKDYKLGIVSEDVNNLIKAGGRTQLQKIYAIDAAYNMKKAWLNFIAEGVPTNLRESKQSSNDLASAAWNSLFVLPEKLIGHALMNTWVPALKTGGYLRTLDTELKANLTMSERDVLKAKNRIWDSMDNRLGQVVYDNSFWDKTIKDLGFMTIRSLGWTGGTIKAFGTGVADIPKSIKNLPKGKGIEHTTAWMMSLPMLVGAYGALYQYTMTGNPPEELKDYFFPKDGTKDEDGNDNRVSLPSYMKDIYAYSKDFFGTASHKLAPFMNDMYEMFHNKDFNSVKIYNEDDPLYQKGIDVVKYQASTMVPFSLKQQPGDNRNFFESVATKEGTEKVMGIMPASKNIERNDTQNTISDFGRENMRKEARTKEANDINLARHEVKKALRAGVLYNSIPKELRDKANYSNQSLQTVIKDSKGDFYGEKFKYLQPQQQLKVWEGMSEKEKELYGKYTHSSNSFIKLEIEHDVIFKANPKFKEYVNEMKKHRKN